MTGVQTCALPIFVFSSIMAEDIKVKAASVGARYQITKPEISQLVEYVARIVREGQEAAQASGVA